MKIGFLQYRPLFGEKQANFEKVMTLAGGMHADLIVLPELFASGYAFVSADEVDRLSEGPGEETSRFAMELAGLTGGAVVAGFIERDYGRYYNSAMLATSGGIESVYRKIHLFNREKTWFAPGNRPPQVHSLSGIKIGIMICFDWIFPEICRKLALDGAQIVAHPSNLVLPWAQKAMLTRSLENRIFSVTANRIGRETRGEDDFHFTGQSQVAGTRGEILASAGEDEECLRIAELDPEKAIDKSVNSFNDLFLDRRPEFYGT